MKRRGFTLIELLAVIVILAIIAVIATPIIVGIIEDSRKAAAEASARNIIKSAETYYAVRLLNGTLTGNIDLTSNELTYSGDQAEKGMIEFDGEGRGSGIIYIQGYCVTYNSDGTMTSESKSSDDCKVEAEPTIYPVFATSSEAYFNPTTGLKCNPQDAVSVLGQKSGCMKWYVFLDSESNSRVKLILDHNTSDEVTEENINAQLLSDTAGWVETINGISKPLEARLISAYEVNEIAPSDPEYVIWNVDDASTSYTIHDGDSYYDKIFYCGGNNFDWLVDHVGDEYCEVGQTSETICEEGVSNCYSNGYWTSTNSEQGGHWKITNGFLESNEDEYFWCEIGVRPVIEVSKKVFE